MSSRPRHEYEMDSERTQFMRKHVMHTMELLVSIALVAGLIGCSSTRSSPRSQGSSAKQESGSQNSSSASNNQQTVEGCVVRRETDFYIEPATGAMTKMNSGG